MKPTQWPPHFDSFSCLPQCDERHAEHCPREKAEMEYYRTYFAVGTPAFWNFAPAGFERPERSKIYTIRPEEQDLAQYAEMGYEHEDSLAPAKGIIYGMLTTFGFALFVIGLWLVLR